MKTSPVLRFHIVKIFFPLFKCFIIFGLFIWCYFFFLNVSSNFLIACCSWPATILHVRHTLLKMEKNMKVRKLRWWIDIFNGENLEESLTCALFGMLSQNWRWGITLECWKVTYHNIIISKYHVTISQYEDIKETHQLLFRQHHL